MIYSCIYKLLGTVCIGLTVFIEMASGDDGGSFSSPMP